MCIIPFYQPNLIPGTLVNTEYVLIWSSHQLWGWSELLSRGVLSEEVRKSGPKEAGRPPFVGMRGREQEEAQLHIVINPSFMKAMQDQEDKGQEQSSILDRYCSGPLFTVSVLPCGHLQWNHKNWHKLLTDKLNVYMLKPIKKKKKEKQRKSTLNLPASICITWHFFFKCL